MPKSTFHESEVFCISFQCANTESIAGDGIDNDCDGKIDEEQLNRRDDDNDGKIDEDLEMVN